MKKLFVITATCVFWAYSATILAAGDPAAGKEKSATCAACHNADGNSANGEWPKLAGQHPGYTAKQLQNFKSANEPESEAVKRNNQVMNGMAAALSEQDMEDLAAYYASQQASPGAADPELVELGKQLYNGGDLATGVSACAACHGPDGAGNPGANFPSLANQHAQYTETQLKAFRSMARANDAGQMMRNITARMNDAQIKAVASYIQGLQ